MVGARLRLFGNICFLGFPGTPHRVRGTESFFNQSLNASARYCQFIANYAALSPYSVGCYAGAGAVKGSETANRFYLENLAASDLPEENL
jgi:hypothetical protein